MADQSTSCRPDVRACLLLPNSNKHSCSLLHTTTHRTGGRGLDRWLVTSVAAPPPILPTATATATLSRGEELARRRQGCSRTVCNASCLFTECAFASAAAAPLALCQPCCTLTHLCSPHCPHTGCARLPAALPTVWATRTSTARGPSAAPSTVPCTTPRVCRTGPTA
jgi:hypothetical protein